MDQAGQLTLDELVTEEYSLDQVAEAYEDHHDGPAPRVPGRRHAHQLCEARPW